MKTAIITGGSRGIGSAISCTLAKNNYNLVINYLNNEKSALELKQNLENKYKIKVLLFKGDISDEKVVKNLVATTLKEFKTIDVVINNAGIAIDNDIFDKDKQEFLRVLEVNLVGTFLLCKEAIKYMVKGTVINISSTDGIDTYNPISMDYCAAKAGVINLTKNLAMRFPNLKIYSVAPNWVKTDSVLEMNPDYLKKELNRIGQKRLLEPDEVANKVLELCQEKKLKSGSIIRVDVKE